MKTKKKYVSNFPVLYRPYYRDNIPGYPGYYVSIRGRVYTRRRVGKGRKSKTGFGDMNTKGYWKELTQVITNKGYRRLVIRDSNNHRYYAQVSRLVATVYIPNPDNKSFVCHKDNNPSNNRVKNLYWGTQSENILQCVRDGRHCNGRYNLDWRDRI